MSAAAIAKFAIPAIGQLVSTLFGSSNINKQKEQLLSGVNNAMGLQQGIWGQQQANQSPYIEAGKTSLAALMQALSSGKFGVGSLEPVPQFTDKFTTPTAAEAAATPGYQFTQQQGNKGILQGGAAAGAGAISGGTLRSLANYNTGLANTTYNDVFNRAMAQYNAALQGYGANLQGYQTGMGAQQQEFNQMLPTVNLGQQAVQDINRTGTLQGMNIGDLMMRVGDINQQGTKASGSLWGNLIGYGTNLASEAVGGLGGEGGVQTRMSGGLGSLGSDPMNLYGQGGYFSPGGAATPTATPFDWSKWGVGYVPS